MQTYICKCGKTFKKLSKSETTGYVLNDYSPRHECYGCPYIVTERSWQTNEIVKRECRATPKITYLSKCHIGTGKGDFSACKLYSLDLPFVKRVMNYVNSLDGAEISDHLNRIPGEWRAADFGICYSPDNCFGLAIFNLYFKNNKAGTAARRLVKERFFSESGVRKDMTEEKERETVLMRIQIAKENARKALERNTGEPTKADIFLFKQYDEEFGRSCRFEKVFGFEHKYAKQHRDKANDLYNEIVSKGLEQAYKKWRKMERDGCQQSMCDTCANNDGNCLTPADLGLYKGECIKYVSASEAEAYLGAAKIEEDKMARKLQFDSAISADIKAASADSFVDSIRMIDVSQIMPNKENFYTMSDLELLADDIEREGLKHNLVVSKDKNSDKYWLKSGHRRFAAIKLLINEKRLTSSKVPCLVDGEKTKAESKLDLIMLNATQRKYSDAEVMSEYEQLSQTLKELDDEGKRLGGRMRENIAKILNISNGQVGKLDNIKHNAAPEVKKAVESGKMSISTANEVAKLTPEKQKEVVETKPDISSAEVKKMQDKKPAAPSKTSPVPDELNSDTEPDDWEDDYPDLDDDISDDDFEVLLSLILSENEAKTLLRFFYRFSGDYGAIGAADTADLRKIQAKLQSLCGKE